MVSFTQSGHVKTVKSSVANPINSGLKLIVNLCGQSGKFESELEKTLSKKWSRVREDYKTAFAVQSNFKLGNVLESAVASDIWVVNMLVKDKEDNVKEDALKLAVKNLAKMAKSEQASVHISNELLESVPSLKEMLETTVVAGGNHLYIYDNQSQK